MEQKVTTPIVKGLVITLILIIYGLILYFSGQFMNKGLSYSQYIILVGGVIWSCTSYAKQMKGKVTFGNVFAHGFKTTAVIILLVVVYTFISIKFLFPDMIDKIVDASRKSMEEQKNMSDEQIDSFLNGMREHFLLFTTSIIILLFAIVGLIASLIGAAVSKKNPPNPFAQQQM